MSKIELRKLSARIDSAMRKAAHFAKLDHKKKGNPIVVADKNGKVRWIQAKDIKVD